MMLSSLDGVEELLARIKEKHKVVNETIVFIEKYKSGKVSKDELIGQLNSCYVTVVNARLFGEIPHHDKDNPYVLLNTLINDFHSGKETISKNRNERFDSLNIKFADVTRRNLGIYLPLIVRGEEEVFEESMREDSEEVIRVVGSNNSVAKILLVNSEFAGYALGHCPDNDDIVSEELGMPTPDPKVLYIDTFVVLPKFQGLGLGKLLLREFIFGAKNKGYTSLEGHFRKEGSGSYHIIKKFGAEDVEIKHNWGDSGEDYVYCRLRLK